MWLLSKKNKYCSTYTNNLINIVLSSETKQGPVSEGERYPTAVKGASRPEAHTWKLMVGTFE